MLNLSLLYFILAMVCGVFYREFTKINGYEGRTALFHTAELSPDEVLERLDALEPDDIDALAAQVLVPEKTALAAAGRVKPSKAYRGMYGG